MPDNVHVSTALVYNSIGTFSTCVIIIILALGSTVPQVYISMAAVRARHTPGRYRLEYFDKNNYRPTRIDVSRTNVSIVLPMLCQLVCIEKKL